MTNIIIPLDMRDAPTEGSEHFEAYGLDMEQILIFMIENYLHWEDSLEERSSICEWFLNQEGFGEEQRASDHDWYGWNETLRWMEIIIQFFKNQIDPYLRLEGFEGPNWPIMHLVRTIGYDVMIAY